MLTMLMQTQTLQQMTRDDHHRHQKKSIAEVHEEVSWQHQKQPSRGIEVKQQRGSVRVATANAPAIQH